MSDYEVLRAKLIGEGSKLGKDDGEEIGWLVAEAVGEANETLATIISLGKLVRELYGVKGEDELIGNPSFSANGHEGMSPKTKDYLRSRKVKGFLGSAFSFAGDAASAATAVNVASIARDGSAALTSAGHLLAVRSVATGFKKSETVTGWVDACVKAKAAKVGIRGASVAGAAVPIPGFSLGVSAATTIAKLGIKLKLGNLLARTALEVHWRAYQEVVIGRSTNKPVGPASAIFYEIFTKRSATKLFGNYDVNKLIREPAGWYALRDKLTLM